MNYYESLQKYYENNCTLHPGMPPVWGEVGYKKFIKKKITDMGIKTGDTIKVKLKWRSGKVEELEGTVLQIYDKRMYLLTNGKKVWKDKSNRKDIIIEYITEIEKKADAKPDFDIDKADPDSKPLQTANKDSSWQTIEKKRIKRYQETMLQTFPNVDIQNTMVLWILPEFYWNYTNGKVLKPQINIIKKNGDSVIVPNYKSKSIYPNHSYYSACGTKNTDKLEDGILLFFDTFEELTEIRLISCVWTVEFNNRKINFIEMIYPSFVKKEGNVFNLPFRCTDMQMYEYSLHSPSVFSGALERNWDIAFLYQMDEDSEKIMDIMNSKDIEEDVALDVLLCLSNNNMKTTIKNFCDNQIIFAETFIKTPEIPSQSYVWPF